MILGGQKMKISKKEFQERRKRVSDLIPEKGSITFSRLMEKTGFSKAEVIFHAVSLSKREVKPVTVLFDRQVVHSFSLRQMLKNESRRRSYRRLMGIEGYVHVYGVGYVNPRSREGRRFLDP